MYRDAFALAGRTLSPHSTQGDALGYVLVAPCGARIERLLSNGGQQIQFKVRIKRATSVQGMS